MSIRISAVVCTHNRSSYLRKAVRSLVEQTLTTDKFEVILVDNGSDDDTRQVVDEFAAAPNLRYLYEPVLGLSRARNTGWQNAEGEYVAYLDDDAVAATDWLARYLDAFASPIASLGSVGGKCLPIWESPRPEWLPDHLLGYFSACDWTDRPTVLDESMWLSGCNIAFSKAVLKQIGGFREDLGRRGQRLLANEEVYLRRQLDALGYVSLYDPRVVVEHHIAARRLTKEWFRESAYSHGISDAIMESVDRKLSVSDRGRLAVEKAVWSLPRIPLALIGDEPQRFRRECQIRESAGFIAGLWGLGEAA